VLDSAGSSCYLILTNGSYEQVTDILNMKDIFKKFIWEILINAVIIICIYYLWNWLVTDLISAKKLTFVQAWGIRALVQFLIYSHNYERNK